MSARLFLEGLKCAACGKPLKASDLTRGWIETKVGLLVCHAACMDTVTIQDEFYGVRVSTMSLEDRITRLERKVL